ncbi:OPT/YSL family transporter [Paraburkholderia acidisoli]|uniref:OPT family oligopeptide transporter n=1 Tax=Paraburkholderia acidisoli TaxID=2571748 RepID=A0A7Z2GQJ3_9BURK|nr:OPT/YSL family transporter [Paraburkholderia acidisoli]QGZ66152.1 OPT family oligopeptide transporter [Paraburkholderia acidisoli]
MHASHSPEGQPTGAGTAAGSGAPRAAQVHPAALSPANLLLLAVLSVIGAIIGIELLVKVGVTPNTSIVGALAAMICARVPLRFFRSYRSVHAQNLAQSAISAATFGAANSLLLPIAIPFLFGREDLVMPMFAGVALGMLLDGYMLYRMFGSSVFPATGTWPQGVAAAEAIKAGDEGGKQARLLGVGVVVGLIGSWLGIPMSAFGTAFIGNIWALGMLGIGFLIRGYSVPLFHFAIDKAYIPHGMMIGAGLVALVQVGMLVMRDQKTSKAASNSAAMRAPSVASSMRFGAIAYVVLAGLIALVSGLYGEMSPGMLVGFVLYAALAAFVHELIVGIAAMHSGWFPAFAVALITLLIGMLIGFPMVSLVVLCGFSAATGPAFADMGYDLKAGFILRGHGEDPAFELAGRKQQLIAAMLAFVVAIPVVLLAHHAFFANGQIPPVAKVYVSTIQAGVAPGVLHSLLMWAVVGAVLQFIGGPKRQLGVLFATGLLIASPLAGWAVVAGIAIRLVIERRHPAARNSMEVFAAGVIAADALYSFFGSLVKTR